MDDSSRTRRVLSLSTVACQTERHGRLLAVALFCSLLEPEIKMIVTLWKIATFLGYMETSESIRAGTRGTPFFLTSTYKFKRYLKMMQVNLKSSEYFVESVFRKFWVFRSSCKVHQFYFF